MIANKPSGRLPVRVNARQPRGRTSGTDPALTRHSGHTELGVGGNGACDSPTVCLLIGLIARTMIGHARPRSRMVRTGRQARNQMISGFGSFGPWASIRLSFPLLLLVKIALIQ